MTISEVACRTGLRASAIRYYEKIGLLPKTQRISGQRRYELGVGVGNRSGVRDAGVGDRSGVRPRLAGGGALQKLVITSTRSPRSALGSNTSDRPAAAAPNR